MSNTKRKYGEVYLRVTPSGAIEYRFRYTDEEGRRKYKSVSGVNEEHCYEKPGSFLYDFNFIKFAYC